MKAATGGIMVQWSGSPGGVAGRVVWRFTRPVRTIASIIALLMAASAAAPAMAETRTLRWESGLCRASLRFDPAKVDPHALQNTVDLLKIDQRQLAPIALGPHSPADLAKLQPAKFEQECAAAMTRLRDSTLLPIDGFEAYRSGRMAEVEDTCRFGSVLLRGHTTSSTFRQYEPAAGHCDLYIDALEGKRDIMDVWRKRIVEQCADNADPAACRERARADGAKPDGTTWIRIYVAAFGWNNCAVHYTANNSPAAKRLDAQRAKLAKTFDRLYKVKEVCDSD